MKKPKPTPTNAQTAETKLIEAYRALEVAAYHLFNLEGWDSTKLGEECEALRGQILALRAKAFSREETS